MSPSKLVLARHSPGAATVDFSSALQPDIPENVSLRVLHTRLLERLALMRENCDSGLSAAPKRYKYDYSRRVCEASAFKAATLVLVDRPQLPVYSNKSNDTDKPNANRLMPRVDRPFLIIGIEQDMTINENGVSNTIPID